MKPHLRLLAIVMFVCAVLLLLPIAPRVAASSCSADSQCASGTACDLSTSTCVSCVSNGDRAADGADCCSLYLDPGSATCQNSAPCYNCLHDLDCTSAQCTNGSVCDQSNEGCTTCVPDGDFAQLASDCCSKQTDSVTGACAKASYCADDSQCSGGYVCDITYRTCFACVQAGDYAEFESDCCSGLGNYSSGSYYCE